MHTHTHTHTHKYKPHIHTHTHTHVQSTHTHIIKNKYDTFASACCSSMMIRNLRMTAYKSVAVII